jgi:hypothetical protein
VRASLSPATEWAEEVEGWQVSLRSALKPMAVTRGRRRGVICNARDSCPAHLGLARRRIGDHHRRMAVVLVINPRQDDVFARLVEELVADETRSPEAVQAALRERYPSASIRPRQLAGETGTVWYVYRDGRWTGG